MIENKVQLSKFEDFIDFVGRFMSWAASHLAIRRGPKGLYKMEGFYREQGRARELLVKEKKGLFWGLDIFSLKEEKVFFLFVFYHVNCLFFLGKDGEGLCDRSLLLVLGQKIPE